MYVSSLHTHTHVTRSVHSYLVDGSKVDELACIRVHTYITRGRRKRRKSGEGEVANELPTSSYMCKLQLTSSQAREGHIVNDDDHQRNKLILSQCQSSFFRAIFIGQMPRLLTLWQRVSFDFIFISFVWWLARMNRIVRAKSLVFHSRSLIYIFFNRRFVPVALYRRCFTLDFCNWGVVVEMICEMFVYDFVFQSRDFFFLFIHLLGIGIANYISSYFDDYWNVYFCKMSINFRWL